MHSRNENQKLTRRRFLESTVATGIVSTVAATATAAASAEPRRADPRRERLESLLETYGSELGKSRRVG